MGWGGVVEDLYIKMVRYMKDNLDKTCVMEEVL